MVVYESPEILIKMRAWAEGNRGEEAGQDNVKKVLVFIDTIKFYKMGK